MGSRMHMHIAQHARLHLILYSACTRTGRVRPALVLYCGVQEGYEPLFKLDTLLEALLQVPTANQTHPQL